VSPDRQRKVVEILEAALELDGEARGSFIERASGGDPSLRDEVWSLILHDEKAGSFMEEPAVDFTTKAIADGRQELPQGSSLGPYEIIRHLGEGGMGVVYLARHIKLDRLVALKLLPEQFTQDKDKVRRFELEARAASKLQHNNIITIYDIARTERVHYIVTEYVDGQTLREHLAGGAMSLEQALNIIEQVASALSAAHEAGIVHRDIKPENIMIRSDGVVKVLDFGLAKLAEPPTSNSSAETVFHTRPGVLIGTPNYMSPEQVAGASVDARSDLFSLGAVLYECVSSRIVFSGQNVAAIWGQIQYVDPPPPSHSNPPVPPELDRIALKALAKQPDERYQSAGELISDLRAARAKLRDVEAVPTKPPPRLNTSRIKVLRTLPDSLRRPRYFISSILVALATTFVAAWLWFNWPHQPHPKAAELYDRGTAALREGTYYEASKILEEAVREDGRFAVAHARLAEAWNELDYTERAKDEMMSAQALVRQQKVPLWLASRSTEPLYIEAIDATLRRDFAKAIEVYDEIARLSPDKPHVYLDLGRTYEKKDEIDSAIKNYQRATELDQQYAAAFLRLGGLYNRKQNIAAANEALERAERIFQTFSDQEGITEVLYQRGTVLSRTGKISEAREQLLKALEITRITNNKYQQIKMLLQLSRTFAVADDSERARQYASQAVEAARFDNMGNLATQGLIDLGNSFLARNQVKDAETYFRQALEFAQRDKGQRSEARSRLALASLKIQQDDAQQARDFAEQALPFFRRGGYEKEVSQALYLLGVANDMKGDYDAALQAFSDLSRMAAQVGDVSQQAFSQQSIGSTLAHQEKYPEALPHLEKSLIFYNRSGNGLGAGYVMMERGGVLWRLGHGDEAETLFERASSLARNPDGSNNQLMFWILLNRARLALSRRSFSDAQKYAREALPQTDTPSGKVEVKQTACLAEVQAGGKVAGLRLCAEAVEQATGAGDPRLVSGAELALAEALLAGGDASKSLDAALRAQAVASRLGQNESEWRAWLIAGQASRELGDHARARECAAKARDALARLQQLWGDSHFGGYSTRTDVQFIRKQLDDLAAAGR
jgi:eukaryotic-like serine/threonine-protein kinase